MMHYTHILADGISPGMVFAIIVAVLIALANLFGKAKQSQEMQEKMRRDRQQRDRGPRTLEEIIQENIRRGEAQQPQRSAKRKQKQRPQPPAPPPLPPKVQPVEPDPPLASPTRGTPSEAARNVRLMLQPSGIREALILSEVLGKPKSLRDE